MTKRITALILAFSFVICYYPVVTRADGVNLVWNCADKPIKVGSVVQISLSADIVQDFRIMVVTPDSKQTFIDGQNASFTVTKPGTHALIGYTIDPLTGQMTGMSVQQRFEAESNVDLYTGNDTGETDKQDQSTQCETQEYSYNCECGYAKVTDECTGDTMQCTHILNGISTLVKQSEPIMVGNEFGHILTQTDICSICHERIDTEVGAKREVHNYSSDTNGKLTCSICSYSVTPANFAEAAKIIGSPTYRIYHNDVFSQHDSDMLFKTTAKEVLNHRTKLGYVLVEEAYDVLDNEDMKETEEAIKKEIVYETLQDIICEKADDTMVEAVQISTILGYNKYLLSFIEETGSTVLGETLDKLNVEGGIEVGVGLFTSGVKSFINFYMDQDVIKQASEEEIAKIAFCLAMSDETERALLVMRDEMGNDYKGIIDELINENRNGLDYAKSQKNADIKMLINNLRSKAIIDFSIDAAPAIAEGIAYAAEKSFEYAANSKVAIPWNTLISKAHIANVWSEISDGVSIAGQIMAGINIGHAIGGAADKMIFAEDQLMIINGYENRAYSDMITAYNQKSPNLYEVTCIYLETLKQGYAAARDYYGSHDSWFAKTIEGKGTTEYYSTQSSICSGKMSLIDNYIQSLNEEQRKYEN